MDPDNPQFGPDNSNDEFYYQPKLNPLFKGLCMRFEGDEGGGGDGGGGGGAGRADQSGFVNPDGTFLEDWSQKLGDEFTEDVPTLSRFKSVADLSKSYSAIRRKFNKDPDSLVEIPGDDSSDEVRAEFHRRRGVPDDAKGYKYEQPESLPENLRSNDEEMAYYYELAKSANLTPKQFKAMADGHFANLEKVFAAQDLIAQEANHKANAEAEKELTKIFGKSYEERVARANAIMRHYGGEEAVAALKLENNPLMVRFIDKIAEDMSEDRIKGITATSIPTSDAIEAKMNELRNQEGYYDSSHKDHKKIMEERKRLAQQRTS